MFTEVNAAITGQKIGQSHRKELKKTQEIQEAKIWRL